MQTNSGKKPALTFVAVLIAALIVCVAIFVRPREQVRTLSNPDKLMANASVAGIWDTSFADKVMRTVFFALILNRDEYSAQNADAHGGFALLGSKKLPQRSPLFASSGFAHSSIKQHLCQCHRL
jgi:hypothetical protein